MGRRCTGYSRHTRASCRRAVPAEKRMRMTQPMTCLSACLRDVLVKAQTARAAYTPHTTLHTPRAQTEAERHPCHRNGLPAASAVAAARRGGGTKSNPTAVSHASRPLRALSNALRSPNGLLDGLPAAPRGPCGGGEGTVPNGLRGAEWLRAPAPAGAHGSNGL